MALIPEERQQLLDIALQTIRTYIVDGSVPDFDVTSPRLLEKQGAFVTLQLHGQLRGCIGLIEGASPLWEAIRQMAVAASTEDPRFPPVNRQEIDQLEIEISVLSPLKKISDPSKVEVGTHGIYMRQGTNSGLLLPQVAVEWGWDREEFLAQTCNKAWLPRDAWEQPDTEIYIFTAEIFGTGA